MLLQHESIGSKSADLLIHAEMDQRCIICVAKQFSQSLPEDLRMRRATRLKDLIYDDSSSRDRLAPVTNVTELCAEVSRHLVLLKCVSPDASFGDYVSEAQSLAVSELHADLLLLQTPHPKLAALHECQYFW